MKLSWKFLLLLILPLAFLIYLGGDFAYPVRGDYSDLAISHLPNAEFLRRSLINGEIPMWSPLLFAGYPFAANPLSGLHYPPGWLALLFPLPFGFNFVTALHLVAAGFGMFLFLRKEGLSDWPAFGAAIAFQAMPKILSHYAAGHLSLVYAVCLTPWLFWAEIKRHESCGERIGAWSIAPGIALGLIVMADLRWAPYAAILWFAYAIRRFTSQRHNGSMARFLPWVGGVLTQGGVVLILSASLWLPLIEFIPLTTRAAITSAERVGISLPAANLLGLFIPSLGSYAEWELYAGALPWLLLIFSLAVPDLHRKVWFWLVFLFLSLLASMGGSIPGYEALSNLPGFSLLRVPSRALFLSGFSFAVLTGFALEYLLQNKVEQKPEPIFFMVPFAAFPLLIAGGMGLYLGGYFQPFLWAGVAVLVFMALILTAERRWLPVRITQGLFVVLMLLEMGGMDATLLKVKDRAEILSAQAEVMAVVKPGTGDYYRVYSPSFSLPQTVTANAEVGLIDGIDPMQLTAYVKLFSDASGIPIDGYTVTLPPFSNGSPQTDNAGYSPNTELLGVLNTKFVVSAFPISAAGLKLVEIIRGTYIYENQMFHQRAWVEDADGEMVGSADIMDYQANRVILQAAGPGKLVLSDVMYPGWQVTVDGDAEVIQPYLGILRSVELAAGNHEVRFTFHPLTVYLGWGISLMGWLVVVIFAFNKQRLVQSA